MSDQFLDYVPQQSIKQIKTLLTVYCVSVKVKKERKTKHGDYRVLANGKNQISINANLNPYRFLITFIHELAHLKAFQTHGFRIKPHGKEWKQCFQHLMLPFINPQVFPKAILPLIARHFKNPKASSDTDIELAYALKQFDLGEKKTYVFEIALGTKFKLYNGKIFVRGKQRRKRFECLEVNTGRVYLFNPNAEVELVVPENTELLETTNII